MCSYYGDMAYYVPCNTDAHITFSYHTALFLSDGNQRINILNYVCNKAKKNPLPVFQALFSENDVGGWLFIFYVFYIL